MKRLPLPLPWRRKQQTKDNNKTIIHVKALLFVENDLLIYMQIFPLYTNLFLSLSVSAAFKLFFFFCFDVKYTNKKRETSATIAIIAFFF